jgi:NAD(P)-dependent dehydrogenase (short-subunit alcohol dehydrogenase family)
VSLVTGGTQGIGRAVAVALARWGDRVLFVGRDAQRGESVLRELFKVAPGGEHVFIRADLSLLSETARVAQRVRELTSTLDAVIFCAGILSTVPEWTEEGLERNFVLNYLTRYLLVIRLLPLLLAAPSGRLVLVANAGRYGDTLDFDDLGHRRGRRGLHVAGRTQFANDLLATELAERTRGSQLEVTCVFPGVARTNLFENSRGIPWVLRLLARFVQLFALSPEQAAQTPVFLASDPEATKLSGRFYGPNNKQLPVPERALREDRRALLWRASEELVTPFLEEERPEPRGAAGQ